MDKSGSPRVKLTDRGASGAASAASMAGSSGGSNSDKGDDSGSNEALLDRLEEKMDKIGSRHSDDLQLLKNGSGPKLLQIFDGAENDDNDNLVGGLLYPPDTDGDVGPNHYVQMTNLVTTIYDKSGNVVLGPFPNNAFFTGLGGSRENPPTPVSRAKSAPI